MSTGFDSSVVVAVRVGSYVTVGIVAFIVVIFFVILYVYLKNLWASNRAIRLRRSGLVIPASNPISFPHYGLGSAVLEALPVTVFHVSVVELECAVCLCKLSDGEQVRMLPKCNHGFHLECIDMWFESHTTCPLCRSRVEIKPTPDSTTEGISACEAVFSSIESSAGVLPANMNSGEDRIISDTGEPSSSSVSTSVNCEGMLVVDIPRLRIEEFSSTPILSTSVNSEGMLVVDIPCLRIEELSSTPIRTQETTKTPISARWRTLTKVLSLEKGTMDSFSAIPGDGSGDIEQGLRVAAGRIGWESS